MRAICTLLFFAACSSSIDIAPTVSTSNSCKNNGDCAAYVQCTVPPCTTNNLSCVSGACIANGNLKSLARLQSAPYDAATPFTLVVTMPDTSSFAGGSALVFRNSDFVLAQPASRPNEAPPCQGSGTTDTCIVVIGNAQVVGDYETDQSTAQDILGVNVNQGSVRTSLPVHTTFRLLNSDETTITTQASIGIPSTPIYASVINTLLTSETPSGPNGSPLVAWESWLPIGRYERQITVDPPFNALFPPWADFIDVTQGRSDQVRLGAPPDPGAPATSGTPLDPKANRTYTITPTSIPLTGWSASIRNSTTGTIISSTTTFGEVAFAPTSVTLNTVTPSLPPIPTPTDLTGDEIVIAPPPGVSYPTLVGVAFGGKIPAQTYPPVPTPAIVSGSVFAANASDAGGANSSTPISAWIDFVSVPGAGVLSQGGDNFDLRYRTSVHTTDNGSYSVTLPRGPYDVIVTPDLSAGYAVTFLNHRVADDSVPNSNDHLVQSGIGLPVNLPSQLSGHVTLTNGRPLGGIQIEARPSLSQFPSSDIPAELATALPSVMPAQRSVTTTTDANGFYSLPVDPGIYDVFAEAPASSGFAWGVTTSREVLAPTNAVDGGASGGVSANMSVDIQVPAPVDATMRLYVPNSSSVVAGALVRAYVAGGPNLSQIQIGEGMTDSNGILKLLLPPYLPK